MPRVTNARLQNWAATLMGDDECLQEVRDRFQLKMLDLFRAADAAKREEINHIMDNEKLFFEELAAICDEVGTVNEQPENINQ